MQFTRTRGAHSAASDRASPSTAPGPILSAVVRGQRLTRQYRGATLAKAVREFLEEYANAE